MISRRPEILAPAGSPDQLVAAVRSGADAVYLGADGFNARRNAANFSREELFEAVRYCHERGAAVYFLLNTVVFDDETDKLRQLVKLACSLPADGIIVQDMATADLIRRCAPDMRLHASTQMTVHNPAAMPLLSRLGFSRAVLSRELSCQEIREITAAGDVETEVFVHGALCMSVSGQCFMSAALGTRSGNRGLCAQPCRLPFRSGGFDYCLSLKDMSHIPHLTELADAGVSSFKIEGRMKRPEYCAAAVTACRLSRDGQPVPQQLSQNLESVFSRSGFTDGYFTGRRGKPMFGHRTKDDAADSGTLSSLHSLYRTEFQRVAVDMTLRLENGKPAELTVSDDDGNRVSVFGDIPSCDSSSVQTEPLEKTGGTPYFVRNISIENDGCCVRPSLLKSLRRDALSQLSAARSNRKPIEFSEDISEYPAHTACSSPDLRAVITDPCQLVSAKYAQRVYVPLEADWLESAIEQYGTKIAVEAPRALFGLEDRLRSLLARAKELGVEECMIHNIGMIDPVKDAGLDIYGGFGLNIANTPALEVYRSLGLCGTELSCELTAKRISALGGQLPRGITVYGRMPLMLTRNCPARLGSGCGGDCSITDRMGKSFPVRCRCDRSFSEVFNTIPLCIVDKMSDFPSVDSFFLRFTVENSVETEEMFKNITLNRPLRNNTFTRGSYYRGAE